MARRLSRGTRDLLIAVAVVGGILAGIFVYTGNWPPLVVIESESMMHCDRDDGWFRCPPESYGTNSVSYGRIGTIDPGDLVFVKTIDSMEDLEFWVDGVDETGRPLPDADLNYGAPGDVIVYNRNGITGGTPIIHRALTHVTIVRAANGDREYDVHWINGVTLHFGVNGVYLPLIGLGASIQDGYKPSHGGIITKGDNPVRNFLADQNNEVISGLVELDWIVGKAQGELPWLGLLKLMWGDNFNVRNPPLQWARVVNAWAPADLWACLAASIAGIFLVPIAFDVARLLRDERERRRDQALIEARERDRERAARGEPPELPPAGAPDSRPLPIATPSSAAQSAAVPVSRAPAPGPAGTQPPKGPAEPSPSVTQKTTCPTCKTGFQFARSRREPTRIACPNCGRAGTLPPLEPVPPPR